MQNNLVPASANVTFALPNGELRAICVEAGIESAAIALGKAALSQWHRPENLEFVGAVYTPSHPLKVSEPFGV